MMQNKSVMTRFRKALQRDWQLYILCLPVLLYVLVFEYIPMYGVQIAFKDYKAILGIWGSEWAGLKWFTKFFTSPQFKDILVNTLTLSVYELFAGFPLPIFIALLLNQTSSQKFKKVVQTTIYAPHFISIVVLCGMLNLFLSPSTGLVNFIIEALGGEKIYFLGSSSLFKHIYVWSGIWQNTGWNTIIYIAALSSINPEHYEAAKVDGASKLQQILYVDIPGILPTIVTLFILRTGSFMSVGFQKAYLLQNSMNLDASEIISTYVYKIGLIQSQFSYSSAIGLFNTIVNVILVVTVNQISRKVNETSLW